MTDDERGEEEQGEPVEMAEELPPEAPHEHRLGPYSITVGALVMSTETAEGGLARLRCAMCNWSYLGTLDMGQMFAQYHLDVVHAREYGAHKTAFVRVKADYKKRTEQSRKDREKAKADLDRAKKEMLEKMEREEKEEKE